MKKNNLTIRWNKAQKNHIFCFSTIIDCTIWVSDSLALALLYFNLALALLYFILALALLWFYLALALLYFNLALALLYFYLALQCVS